MRNGPCCREKAVLVTVFVEKPTRRVPANHHHRQPLLHHPITQTIMRNRGGGKGYDRKAELLRYSQGLRESARSTSSTLMHPPAHNSHNQPPKTKIVAVQVTRYSRVPTTCMGSWKNLIPNFQKSSKSSQGSKEKKKHRGITTSKMNTIVKSFQTQKKSGFFSRFISSFQKKK